MFKSIKGLLSAPDRRRGELVQIYSRRAVFIEGVKRVLKLGPSEIVLEASCTVAVYGASLVLRQLGDLTVCAEGRIDSVSFSDGPC